MLVSITGNPGSHLIGLFDLITLIYYQILIMDLSAME